MWWTQYVIHLTSERLEAGARPRRHTNYIQYKHSVVVSGRYLVVGDHVWVFVSDSVRGGSRKLWVGEEFV